MLARYVAIRYLVSNLLFSACVLLASQNPAFAASVGQETELFYLQLGLFASDTNASNLARRLKEQGVKSVVIETETSKGRKLNRVVAGPYKSRQKFLAARQNLRALGYEPQSFQRSATVNTSTAAGPVTVNSASVAATPEPVGQAPQQQETPAPEVQAIANLGGVLTPKGSLVIEPNIEYANSQVNRFTFQGVEVISALLIGVFEAKDTDRDVYATSLTGRLGLTSRLEAELKIPYVRRKDEFTATIPQVESGDDEQPITISEAVDGDGLGDIELALHYQFNNGRNGWPYFVGNLRYKFANADGPFDVARSAEGIETELPVGSGFEAIEPSVTFLYPSDPAMFFGNLGYLIALDESVNKIQGDQFVQELRSGDSVRFHFGMAYAINPTASFTLGYKMDFIQESEVDIRSETDGLEPLTVSTTDLKIGALLLGFGFQVNPKFNVNLNFEFGITADAPDIRMSLRLPYRWKF